MEHTFEVYVDFVEDWLAQDRKKSSRVSKKARAIFLRVFETFQDLGPVGAREILPRTRTKHLFDDIWEIRCEQFRIAYFWHSSTCVLLHGIKKKQDKWSTRDKETAGARKSSYLLEASQSFEKKALRARG